ncbi:hypothetical protein [Streptomyces sp. NPDC087270]|uniref:hypothetical protein n=1 Tax=Streptomyces sp. NPDC087270 TaxID=3365774 RepID=UPI0038267A2A
MAPRTKFSAAAGTLTAAALLLTACGGGHDKKIASSPTPSDTTASQTTAPPTTPAADPSAPTFDFPSDVKITVDSDTTGDKTKDAILRDQGYGQEAMLLAVTKQDPSIPVFTKYVSETAAESWIKSVDSDKAAHRTLTGKVRFYDRKVTVSSATTAGVTFCEDQRYGYDKNTETGKVTLTKADSQGLIYHSVFMRKAKDGTWQTATYNSQRGATRCES